MTDITPFEETVMKSIGFLIFTLGISFVAPLNSSVLAATVTALQFESSPQSWVGQGQSHLITPEDNFEFSVSRNFDNGVSFDIDNLDTNPPSDYKYWNLDLAAPFSALLTPGLYTNAARFPFQADNQPGLTFSGNHRGNNRNSGFFEVLEASYFPDGTVEKFAVNFTQYGEENPNWWIHGKLRYNSNITLDGSNSVPEPLTILGSVTALGFGALLKREHSKKKNKS